MQRPLGVTIISGIFIFVGGFTSVIIFIEIIDSIRFFGFSSLVVTSIESLLGFLIFAGTPFLMYWTGAGLFMRQPWSRKAAVGAIPFLLFLYYTNLAFATAYRESLFLSPSVFDLWAENSEIFMQMFVRFTVTVLPIMYYFRHPNIVRYFQDTPKTVL